MLAVKTIDTQDVIDIYQCPEGKSAVVYIDLFIYSIQTILEIDIAIWDDISSEYLNYTYWRGSGNFVSLGPIWLNSKDKIRGFLISFTGMANCFVHGKEY
jgi:hypothetical protein